MSTPGGQVRDDLGKLLIRSTQSIAEGPWTPLPDTPGATQTLLWRSGEVLIGIIRMPAGSQRPAHTHDRAHHHILITSGSCRMVGQLLKAGSYVHIPAGTPHEVTDVGPQGCEFFYTYRPVQPAAVSPAAPDADLGTPV